MIKKCFHILVFTFIFLGCAERGSIVNVTPIQNETTKKAESETNFPKLTLSSSREDKTKKTISGSLIIIIGLLLIL